MIYHGKARTFLDPKMFEQLTLPADYVKGCIMVPKLPTTSGLYCSNFSSSMAASGFALVARQQLAKAWDRSLSDLEKEDPWTKLSK